jgi:hypothetical protein
VRRAELREALGTPWILKRSAVGPGKRTPVLDGRQHRSLRLRRQELANRAVQHNNGVVTDKLIECVYCKTGLKPGAILCKECREFQTRPDIAKLRSTLLYGAIKLVSAGALLWFVSTMYDSCSSNSELERLRARNLASSAIKIQVLAEQFLRPCPLGSKPDCDRRFLQLMSEFTENTYVFKEEARNMFRTDDKIKYAVDFVDDFYNPGNLRFDEMDVNPLQIELLRSRPFLSATIEEADQKWCTLEGRQQIRNLMLSVDTYRYCYKVVRKYAAFYASGSKVDTTTEEFQTCAAIEPIEDKANRIARKLSRLDNVDHSAPWNYDAFCRNPPIRSISGGLVPASTSQLIVVTTGSDTSDSPWTEMTGTLRLLERTSSVAWTQTFGPINVQLGKHGMGWGRGLHPMPLVIGTDRTATNAPKTPIKTEGDGRAPAGLFDLGRVFHRIPIDTHLPGREIADASYCDDRVLSTTYNTAISSTVANCGTNCGEALARQDGVYDVLVWVNHNVSPAVPRGGSCIFLHISHPDRRGTSGCTAMDKESLVSLLGKLEPSAEPLLLQLPVSEYSRRREAWVLPALERVP